MIFDFASDATLIADRQATRSQQDETIAFAGGAGLADVRARYHLYVAETTRISDILAVLEEKVALATAGNIQAAIVARLTNGGGGDIENFCGQLAGWKMLADYGADLVTAVAAIQTAQAASFVNFKTANAGMLAQLGLS